MSALSLKLPLHLNAKLAATARKRGTTKSAVVREALESYLDGDNATLRGTLLELAPDLVGCLKGPRGLSYNKQHMKGYGR